MIVSLFTVTLPVFHRSRVNFQCRNALATQMPNIITFRARELQTIGCGCVIREAFIIHKSLFLASFFRLCAFPTPPCGGLRERERWSWAAGGVLEIPGRPRRVRAIRVRDSVLAIEKKPPPPPPTTTTCARLAGCSENKQIMQLAHATPGGQYWIACPFAAGLTGWRCEEARMAAVVLAMFVCSSSPSRARTASFGASALCWLISALNGDRCHPVAACNGGSMDRVEGGVKASQRQMHFVNTNRKCGVQTLSTTGESGPLATPYSWRRFLLYSNRIVNSFLPREAILKKVLSR